MDDPHHPHKKVHKHFSVDGPGKMTKSMKKQSRRGTRQGTTAVFSSRVPTSPLHGMTTPLDPFPNKHKQSDDSVASKTVDGEAKGKREDSRRRQGKNHSGSQELRCTIEVTASRHQPQVDPPKASVQAGRVSFSSSRHFPPGLVDPMPPKPQPPSKPSMTVDPDTRVRQLGLTLTIVCAEYHY